MPRLIDADELIVMEYGGIKFVPKEFIDDAPTVDAVEVIRCKDCTYGEQDDIGRWYCISLGCQVGNEDGTGFCADAERRQE